MTYAPPVPPKRPVGIAILAILVVIAGGILTFISLLLVLGATILYVGAVPYGGILVAIMFIVFLLCLLLLASGIGLWRLRPWAWWLAAIVTFLLLLFRAAQWYQEGYPMRFADLLPLAIPLIIILYLFAVRGSFRQQTAQYAQPYPPR